MIVVAGYLKESIEAWAVLQTSFLIRQLYDRANGEFPMDIPTVLFSPISARSQPGTISLADFTHPETACYVFGSDLPYEQEELDATTKVYIPTKKGGELYAAQAAAIVLYDLSMREG